MNKSYKRLFFISISLCGLGLIAYAGNNLLKGFSEDNNWAKSAIKQETAKIDPKLVEKFIRISAMVNPSMENFKISGKISITNPVDSTQNLYKLAYLYQKEGDNYYNQMGQSETIIINGISVYVDHSQKKVMLGKNKGGAMPIVLPDLAKLTKQFRDEKYQLWDRSTGEQNWTISLINPTHITCKSFDLTYDSLTLKPNRIDMRLSNFDDPLNNKKDKIIRFENLVNEQPDIKLFSVDRFIIKQQDQGYTLSEKYKEYELIVLPGLKE